jgi:hypothetical protein
MYGVYSSWPEGPSYFPLMESNQRSSRNAATLRALPVLNALPLRSAPLSKAKPSFPPYARPAPLRRGLRSFFSFCCSARFWPKLFLLTEGGLSC